ncbi:uncharacterized protein LOC134291768 [Aedes albopictus]|uniref:Integrase catalytic domain-containing protein n=1 Tax=Aedes albopictus TaxID=7160 RepID=A0ABM1YSS6_AEDAL
MEKNPPPARSLSRRSSSSTARARIVLELKRLDDERALQEKAAEEKVMREKEYLAKKYDLMQAQLEEEEEGSARSRRSMSSILKVEQWLQNDPVTNSCPGIGYSEIPAGVESRTGTVPKQPKPSASSAAAAISTPKSGQDPLDWSLTWDEPVGSQPPAKGKYAVNLQEIQRKFRGVQLCPPKPNQQPVGPSPLIQSMGGNQPITGPGSGQVPTTTSAVTSGPQPCQVALDHTAYHTGQSSGLEALPTENQAPVAVTPVSQSCSDYTLPQVRTNTVTFKVPKLSSLIEHTPNVVTEPCKASLPLRNDTLTFHPIYKSTPYVRPEIAPSVHFAGYPITSSSGLPTFAPVRTVSSNPLPAVSSIAVDSGRPIPIPPSDSTSAHVQTAVPWINAPTSQQLAARHIVPKELPIFSGDPVEWPLFVSCYQNTTQLCGFSNGENLMRLQRSLKGNALEAVRSLLLEPSSVPLIISTLQTLFGRPDLIINSLIHKVRATPSPKLDKLESLISFGLACQNLCGHLRAAGQQAHFSNPALLQELVNKLPANIKLDWALFKQKCPVVDLGTFGDYMSQLVVAASDVAPFQPSEETCSPSEKRKSKERLFLNAHSSGIPPNDSDRRHHTSQTGSKQPKPCPMCEKSGHKVRECEAFKKCSLEDRWKRTQDHHLCRRCLIAHGKFPCKASLCGVDGCEERHHKLLHPGKPDPVSSSESLQAIESLSIHCERKMPTLFRIIPVTLFANEKTINTFAFLDEGSSSTLIEARVARELGVKGEVYSLCLQWTGDVERSEDKSELIRLEISGRGSPKRHVLKSAHTVEKLCLPKQTLQFKQLSEQFPYLRGLPIEGYSNATPTVLIGVDNAHLKIPLKIREGQIGQPVATKTRLGWTVYGEIPGEAPSKEHCQYHMCEAKRSPDDELHDLVKEFFSVENVGVAVTPVLKGSDEIRSRKILEDTTVRLPSGRFQTGLLWKYDHIEFPDSKPMAVHRLKSLERRLLRNPELFENLKQQIVEYVKKGYAHKITQEEIANSDPERTWYLPLGVVVHPKKPEKVRIVWDAAAAVQGQSLNAALLAGPDLLTSLPSVLSRYRQRQVAISGDIRQMFHQFQIRPEDKQSQRFLFRSDVSKTPDTYVMDVATFGVTCSPSAAQYIKNRNAKDFESEYPEAAAAIIHNHYVDDYLDSLDTIEEAIDFALQVKEVHAKAGFHIRNWMSSSKEVLSRVGDTAEEQIKSFRIHTSSTSERVLGMNWIPDADEFAFTGLFRDELMPLLHGDVIPTKRQLLQVVMSVFDSLGLVSLVIVHGKILIQNVWRANIEWDGKLTSDLFIEWRRWIDLLGQLDAIRIPRCYFPGYFVDSFNTLELHIFVDASEEAYVAAAYFRIVDNSQIRCVLVSSKTKVAPLKPLSVPRLELQAALLGARLSKSVTENHTLQIVQRFFWSDSTTVLAWLQSDQRKYRQFVACRVSEILDSTKVDEWRYVPSKLNVADDATKWKEGLQLNNNHRWFQGPSFLYDPPHMWPKPKEIPRLVMEELRTVHVHQGILKEPLVQFSRFSKWERCLRAVAFVHRFIDQLKHRMRREPTNVSSFLTRDELQRAEITILLQAQFDVFADEIIMMQNNQTLPLDQRRRLEKTSPLYKLSPFLDNRGVIRMESRIASFSDAPFDFKFPIVLPKNHYVSQLIVDDYHRRYNHCNGETTVNEMRQRFHLSEMRAAFRKSRKVCSWCRVYKAIPSVPRMAPLPEARVTPYVRPFKFVGLDYFGPMLVVQGRHVVKRWVALFTCLAIRAVHLELVSGLSTECCKMAIRRFIARRGAPSEIYSDRGTNFVGVSGELREQIRGINNDLASVFTNTVTQWRFNPPAAPHMGGAWERMVRSVKCALAGLSAERKPNEETLVTLLAEAEYVVNSRPLTYMPLETAEHEALTPNCFLLLSTSGVNQPPSQLSDEKVALRSSWTLYQQLLDQFWVRWIKEYLPTITKRTKWFVDSKPVSAGDLVMIVEDRLRNGWIRGRVLRVFPGRDGRCRSANVKTSTGVLRRPVAKLAVLEVEDTARGGTEQYGSGNVQDGAVSPRFLPQESELTCDGRETTTRKNDDLVADQ